MVKIEIKYGLRTIEGLPEKKRFWWLKRDDVNDGSSPFVKGFPRISADKGVDADIPLDDGCYTAGCGDWSVVDEQGYHLQKRAYIIVKEGVATVYNKKAEYEAAKSSDTATEKVIEEKPEDIFAKFDEKGKEEPPKSEPVVEDVVGIDSETKMLNPKTFGKFCLCKNEISHYDNWCADFKAVVSGGTSHCGNCQNARAIFYRNRVGE